MFLLNMKTRTRLLSLVLFALAVFLPANANHQLTLFDGDDSSNTAPINLVDFDSIDTRTQVIFPASSLAQMVGEVINSMKFYTSEPITEGGGMLQISIGETDQTDFAGSTYVEGLTQVATYSMTSGLTEIEIVFNEPYTYMGGNLVFESFVTETTNYSFVTFWGTRPNNYNAISRNEISKFLPKTTFDYGTNEPYSAKVLPFELTFKTIRAEREDVQNVVVSNTGLNGFTPTFSTQAPFSVATPNAVIPANGSLEVPVTFAPTAAGTYEGVLTIDCGEAGILTVPLHGTAIAAAQDLTVCDSTDYASYVPIYGLDIDVVGTESQMIYPSTMLTQMAGHKITGLKFHIKDYVEMNGGVIQLSLKEVSDSAFSSATLVNDLTAVATYIPVLNSTEMAFWFDQPFEYHGGHLLVDCAVIEAGKSTYRQTFFYGTPTEYSASIYHSLWYGNTFDTELVPFLPLATFEYEQGEAPSILRGDVNQDKTVNIGDVTDLISILLSGSEPTPEADCDLDTRVTIGDVTTLISYLLSGQW
jgi:hypothetical protein